VPPYLGSFRTSCDNLVTSAVDPLLSSRALCDVS
jgi:hypothetical protein